MTKTKLLCAAGATAILALATPASADITTVTVTGHVAPYTWNGSAYVSTPLIDNGTFGSAGHNLFGDAFTAQWTINTGCMTCNYVSGGTGAGNNPVSPVISATLTINGGTVSYNPSLYGVTYTYHQGSSYPGLGIADSFYVNVTEAPGQRAMNQFVDTFFGNGTFPDSINAPLNYVVNPATDNLNWPLHLGGSFSYNGVNGYLYTETVVRTNPTYAVPGPIAGAGLPGLVLACGGLLAWWRRRQKNTAER
jgi:hypothetical protein